MWVLGDEPRSPGRKSLSHLSNMTRCVSLTCRSPQIPRLPHYPSHRQLSRKRYCVSTALVGPWSVGSYSTTSCFAYSLECWELNKSRPHVSIVRLRPGANSQSLTEEEDWLPQQNNNSRPPKWTSDHKTTRLDLGVSHGTTEVDTGFLRLPQPNALVSECCPNAHLST